MSRLARAGEHSGVVVKALRNRAPSRLLRNRSLLFASQDVLLRVENSDSIFTQEYEAGQILRMPIAHAEGNYHADDETLDRLEGEGRVLFRYANADGEAVDSANPNGSARSIAGIVNESGNVMGMMPHPERAVEPILGSVDGLGLFHALLSQFAPLGAL